MTRLAYNKVKDYRLEQLSAQGGCCHLCGQAIVDDAVLDHCHKTGLIRRVLHRGCNALLGKIENNMPRNRITVDRLDALARNLVTYITTTHTDIHHPTYKDKTMNDDHSPLPTRGMRTAKNKKRPKPPKR